MLDDLVKVIETLQQRMKSHGATLRENEIRTRMALIDPLLQALGWDTADPAAARPEYDVSGLRVDYALLRLDGNPAAVVEAKKLGESLEPHRMQMLNYANASAIRYAGLSDGDRWELYDVFLRVPLENERRRILKVSVSGLPAHEIALKMLLLWRPNLSWGQPVRANEPITRQRPQAEPAPRPERNPDPMDPMNETARQPGDNPGWIALSEFVPRARRAPTAIRFPGGVEERLGFWWKLIYSTARWLLAEGHLTQGTIPVPAGRRRHLINDTGVHPNGNRFVNPSLLETEGTTLFVFAAFGRESAVRHTRRLLQHCGRNPAEVFVQVGNPA